MNAARSAKDLRKTSVRCLWVQVAFDLYLLAALIYSFSWFRVAILIVWAALTAATVLHIRRLSRPLS